jgi:hypothetical protein
MSFPIPRLASLSAAALLLAACGGASTTDIDGGGGDGGGSNDSGATTDGGGTDGGGTDGGGTEGGSTDGGSACNAPTIDLTFASCPADPTCGGTIADGMYYYTTGCIPDPWAQAKQGCQALTVSNQKGSVKGCVTFAGGVVTRDVQSSYSATLNVPTSCLLGGTCTQLQNLLQNYLPTATCTASTGGCTCDVSASYAGTGAGAYTTSNNQIVTSTNNHYDYCITGTGMDVQWKSGPNTEPGVYSLTKQ